LIFPFGILIKQLFWESPKNEEKFFYSFNKLCTLKTLLFKEEVLITKRFVPKFRRAGIVRRRDCEEE